ncbi:insulinase family protein [Patescibacteria group bacterium]|nr:insulinase family protein [Patescibacteria group bacterium]
MYTRTKFKNGLNLITVPSTSAKTITVLALFGVGSRYERVQQNGMSHFVEHMMFKGTNKRKDNLTIASELDGLGAEYNAFTSTDYTGYYIKSIKQNVHTCFDVLSDMLFNSVFDKNEITKEKGVILEEIKIYKENPMFYIGDVFQEVLYGKHPLGRNIVGPPATVKSFTRQGLMNYKNKFYNHNKMILAVAGNISKQEVINLTDKYFNIYKTSKRATNYTSFKVPANIKSNRVKVVFNNLKQTQIALGGFAYPYNHVNIDALKILSIILGGNMSSRLFSEVRVKRGLAYYIKFHLDVHQDVGGYSIITGVDKSKTRQAIKVILAEINKLKQNGITKQELVKAKKYFIGMTGISLEDSASLASWYARQLLLKNEVISVSEQISRIKRVSRADVQKAINYLMTTQGIKMGVIGPFKNNNSLLQILKRGV